MPRTPRTFSPETTKVGQEALEARERYLQAQAAAWLILTEQQLDGGPEAAERAKQISLASLNIATDTSWRNSRILVQEHIWANRNIKLSLHFQPRLTNRVHNQLRLYTTENKRFARFWNANLELLRDYAAAELEIYESCIVEILEQVTDADELTPGELDLNFARMGLKSYPPLKREDVGADMENQSEQEDQSVQEIERKRGLAMKYKRFEARLRAFGRLGKGK